jgi:hypothetical protein
VCIWVPKGVQCNAILVNVAGTQGIEQSQARGWAAAKKGLCTAWGLQQHGASDVTGGRLWNVYRHCNCDALQREGLDQLNPRYVRETKACP